jgi:MFS family permease
LTAALYLPSTIFAIGQGMLLPVLPLYAADFEVGYSLIGLVLAGQPVGQLLGDVPAGLALRRWGGKASMLAGVSGAVLATFGLFLAATVWQAFLFQVMAGFCGALYNVSRHDFIASSVVVSSRGRSIALFGGIYRIGRFLGPVMGGGLAGVAGLRVPFLAVVGLGLMVLIIVWRFVPRTERAIETEDERRERNYFSMLRQNRQLLTVAGAGMVFVQMVRTGWATVIPLFGADVLGLGVEQIGLIIGAGAAFDTLMFLPAGIVMDRFGRKWAIVPSFILQGTGMVLVALSGDFWGLLLAACWIGFGNGLSSGTMMTVGADLSPEKTRGEFLGTWRLIGDVGASSGPLVVGVIAGALALPAAALVIAGMGGVAASIFGRLVPETLRRG